MINLYFNSSRDEIIELLYNIVFVENEWISKECHTSKKGTFDGLGNSILKYFETIQGNAYIE